MSTNPKSIYNEFIRANLPFGITYDEVRAQYVTFNGKRFPTYLQAKWYVDYIDKLGVGALDALYNSLFGNDEQGVWYDPSDLDTLFQDTAGTTPVTTAGQTVGLMLDKSQGLTLGSELVTNGTFDTDLSGWSNYGGTDSSRWLWDSGTMRMAGFNDVFWAGTGPLGLSAGQTVLISFNVTNPTNTPNIRVRLTDSGIGTSADDVIPLTNLSSDRSFSVITNVDGDKNLVFYVSGSSGEGYNVDNISVKELPGNHATQPTAAARPTYQTDGTLHWLEFDGVDDFMATPTITPGIDKSQMFIGARRSGSVTAVLAETGPTSATTDGTIGVFYNPSFGYGFSNRGTIRVISTIASGVSPISRVISGIGDITEDITTLRLNQSAATNADNLGVLGGYSTQPLYIGRRVNGDFPFDGNIYSLITRFGPNLETSTIETTETYVAGKTGVTL